MIEKFRADNWYLCVKAVSSYYIKDKIYNSDSDGFLTDERTNKGHSWNDNQRLNEHFIELPKLELIAGKTYVCIRDCHLDMDSSRQMLFEAGVCYKCPKNGSLSSPIRTHPILWPSNKKGFYFKEIE